MKLVLINMEQLHTYLFNALRFFGVDPVAFAIVASAFGVLIVIYGVFMALKVKIYKEQLAFSKDEPMKDPHCPSCNRNLYKKLYEDDVRTLYAGYGQRVATCECLAVSNWDVLGVPTCLEWRPPTTEEIKKYHEQLERRAKQQKLEEYKKCVERARQAKRRG